MAERRLDERELDRFLDDLVAGRAAAGGYDLDPDAMAAVREARALVDAPLPPPTYERMRPTLRNEIVRLTGDGRHQLPTPRTGVLPVDGSRYGPNGRASASPWRVRRRWAFTQLATAALLLLVLGAGVGAYRLGGFGPADDGHGVIPAPGATPVATSPPSAESIGAETLFAMTLGSSALPRPVLDNAFYDFKQRIWAPGASATYAAGATDTFALLCVIVGTLNAVVDGADAGILRAAEGVSPASEAPLAAGTEAALRRGDCLRHPVRTAVEVRNPGPEELRVLETFIPFRAEPTGDAPVTTRFVDFINPQLWPEGSGWLLSLRLDRRILAPGEMVAPPPTGRQHILTGEAAADAYALSLATDGTYRNAVARPVAALVVNVWVVGDASATPTA